MKPDGGNALETFFKVGMRRFVSVSPPGGRPEGNLAPSQMGKAPAKRTPSGSWMGYNWLDGSRPRMGDVEDWLNGGANLGLVGDRYPALDIDSLDPAFVEHVAEFAKQTLGNAPCRVGRAPKLLMVYACAEDTPKRTLHVESPDGKRHLVEWLGHKQQYLIHGTHPTGVPYVWPVPVDVQQILEVTDHGVADFFARLSVNLPDGWKVVGRSSGGDVREVDAAKLLAPSMETLRDLVASLPNEADREDWVRMGLAIKGACGEHDDEGFSLFLDWSNRWEGGHNDPAEVRRTWRSLHSKQMGWEWLEAFARRGTSLPDVRDLFEGEEGGGEGEEVYDERLARLVGAERVFLREMGGGTLRGEALRDRLTALRIAEARTDSPDRLAALLPPLLALAERRHLLFPMTDEGRARRILKEMVGGNKTLSPADRDLLVDAALLTLQNRSDILTRGPLRPLEADEGGLQWLVQDMIPRNGVVALVGAPGQGKTHIACHIAKQVAATVEDDFPDFPQAPVLFCDNAVTAGSVIYFAGEDARGVVKRLSNMGANTQHIVVFDHVPNFSSFSDTSSDLTVAIQSLLGKPPVRLIVVDMLLHAMTGDENTVESLRPVLKTAEAMARLWDCAVLFVHHPSKAETELESLRPRGSSAFEGAVDWWAAVGNRVHEGKNGDRRIFMLERKNKHAGMHMYPFRFHLSPNGVVAEGDLPREDDVTPEMMGRAIVRVLHEVDSQDRGMAERTLKMEVKRLYPQWAQNYTLFHERFVNGRAWALDTGHIEWYSGTKIRSTHKERTP